MGKTVRSYDQQLLQDLKERVSDLEYEREVAEANAAYWEEYAHELEDRLHYYERDDE
jgi:hypothetical protein